MHRAAVVAQRAIGRERVAHEIKRETRCGRRRVAIIDGPVVDPLPLASRREEPGVSHNGEMSRDGRGGQPDEFDQLADAEVLGEAFVGGVDARREQPDASRVCEGLSE